MQNRDFFVLVHRLRPTAVYAERRFGIDSCLGGPRLQRFAQPRGRGTGRRGRAALRAAWRAGGDGRLPAGLTH